FAEDFLTGRSFAEPAVLLALVAWSRRRTAWALALFVFALAMHPLIALPGIVIAWLMRVHTDRRWAWLALLALPIVGLGVAHVAPFDGLLRFYDPDWWDDVSTLNKQVLLGEWGYLDWQSIAVDPFLLWFALRHGEHRLALLARAALWATPGLLAVSILGVDLGHNVLLTGLQPWRVLWITHLLALACLPIFVHSHWRLGPAGRLAAVAGIAALLAAGANFPQAWILIA